MTLTSIIDTLFLMRAIMLYRPNSEFARTAEEYVKEFADRRNQSIQLLSLDTVEGSEMARLYDIMQYPALLVVREDDNQLVRQWQGEQLPLMDEVAGFLNS